jgi:hypothetical protein
LDCAPYRPILAAMGIRTRGLDIVVNAKREAADPRD